MLLFLQSLKVQTQNAITNAQAYLQGHLQAGTYDGEDDSSYTLAIVTKALVCSSSTSQAVKNMAITKLESKAINNGNHSYSVLCVIFFQLSLQFSMFESRIYNRIYFVITR